MTLRALLVDDEDVARRRMRRLLASAPDIEVVGECGDGAAAVAAVRADPPDLMFLDVQMPELDGFAVVRSLPIEAVPSIIFVTAFDQYAMQAFDVHAIDYLLKPISARRFHVALERARERIRSRRADAGLARLIASTPPRRPYLSRVAVRTGRRILLVDLRTIEWIDAADNYVRLHAGAREYVLRETLASLEQQLDPELFVRIHRSVIVRIDRIQELHPASHGDMDVVLRDGTTLTMSRTWRARAERILGRI